MEATVQVPGHERGPEAGLRLKRLCRNEVEEPDGHRQVERHRALGGFQGRLVEAWQAQRGGARVERRCSDGGAEAE